MDYRKIAEDALKERAQIFEKRKALNEDTVKSDDEKRAEFERMDADMDVLSTKAREAVEEGERAQAMVELETRAGKLADLRQPGEERQHEGPDVNDILRKLGRDELRAAQELGISADVAEFRATTKVTDGTGWGNKGGVAGPVTPDTFVATLIQFLEQRSDVLSQVQKISTSTGEPMTWPRRSTKVTNTFQAINEGANFPSTTDGAFTLFTLSSVKFGAIGAISKEALYDPKVDVSSLVAQEMGEDLADKLAHEVWRGTNLAGNILDNSVNSVTLVYDGSNVSTKTTPTFDTLIDLEHSITAPYRKNASFVLNDTTARVLRKIKDGNQNYIWQPAVIAGQPDMLLGKPVSTEIEVPALTIGGKGGVYFGDLNKTFLLRTVRSITLERSTEFGFGNDTVAIKVSWRGDGDIYDPNSFALLKPAAS